MTELVTIEFAAWVCQLSGAFEAGDYRSAGFAAAPLGLTVATATLRVDKVVADGQV
jgi:hypothetical protein